MVKFLSDMHPFITGCFWGCYLCPVTLRGAPAIQMH